MSKIKNLLAVAATGLLLASCGVSGDAAPPTTAPNVSSEVGAEIGIDEDAIAAESEAKEPTAAEKRAALSEAHSSYHSGGYQSEPEDDEISDADLNRLALELTWDSQSALDQEDFCWGWNYDQAMMVDAFLEGAGDSYSRSEVKSFFNGKC